MDYDKTRYYIFEYLDRNIILRLNDGSWNSANRKIKELPADSYFSPQPWSIPADREVYNKHANPLGWNMTEEGIERMKEEDKTVEFIMVLDLDNANPRKKTLKIRKSDGYYYFDSGWKRPQLDFTVNIQAYNKAAAPLGWQLDKESNLLPIRYTFCELPVPADEFIPEKELFNLTPEDMRTLFYTEKKGNLVQKYEQPMVDQILAFMENKIKEIQRSTRELGYCPNHSMVPLTIQYRTLGSSTNVLIATCLECQKEKK